MVRFKDGFNYKELDELNRDIVKLANETMPKESKKFMTKEGRKITKEVKGGLRTGYKVRTGNLFKKVKRGKSYFYPIDSAYQIRVHMAPHENVVDYEHRTKKGKVVKGKRIKDRTEAFFSEEFEEDVMDFIDDLLDKGLS